MDQGGTNVLGKCDTSERFRLQTQMMGGQVRAEVEEGDARDGRKREFVGELERLRNVQRKAGDPGSRPLRGDRLGLLVEGFAVRHAAVERIDSRKGWRRSDGRTRVEAGEWVRQRGGRLL